MSRRWSRGVLYKASGAIIDSIEVDEVGLALAENQAQMNFMIPMDRTYGRVLTGDDSSPRRL